MNFKRELEGFIDKIEKNIRKDIFLDLIKRKFSGSVRDFLIWYGGDFKDIDITDEEVGESK